jgi:aminoglycoside phosphotransferase (APT) family kinase protein
MRTEAVAAATLDTYQRAARAAFFSKADVDVPDEVLQSLPQAKATFAASAAQPLSREFEAIVGSAPSALEFLRGQGTFHAVFRIEAAARVYYARTSVPSIPEPALDFLVDAWAAESLPRHGIPTPDVLHVDLSRSRVPFDLELVAAVRGEPLSGPRAPGAEDGARALGALAAKVHSIACRGFGPLDPAQLGEGAPGGLHDSWRDYVLLRLEAHLDACRDARALTAEQTRLARSAFRRAEPLLAGAPSALLHGDLGNHNVFVENGEVSALIDWEDSAAGDPIFDVASWGTFVGNHERREAFLLGYGKPDDLPADFELRYWLYYLRIMLAKTVHRQRFGYALSDKIPASARLAPALEAVCAHMDGADGGA